MRYHWTSKSSPIPSYVHISCNFTNAIIDMRLHLKHQGGHMPSRKCSRQLRREQSLRQSV